MDELVRHLAERYSAGADIYKQYWLPILTPMGKTLLDLLPVSGAKRILDVGTGPGSLIAYIHQRSPSAQIVAIDISRKMIALAPTSTNAHFSLMDASRLALDQNGFDLAVLAFVIFHYPDITAGLEELKRILRPGAVVGSAVFHTSPEFEAKRIWDAALAEEIEKTNTTAINLSAVDKTEMTNRSKKSKALFNSAGFTEISTTERAYAYQWKPDDYRAFRSGFGSSGEKFRSLPVESQTRLSNSVRESYLRLQTRSFQFEPVILYTTAKKPA